jgi:hypothetical protein
MGTGVGEAMLIGAMTGAGTSAITGGDPLKGALLGAAGGGIGAGVGGALAGGTSGAATGATAAPITNATLASGSSMVPGLTASAPALTPTMVSSIPGSAAAGSGTLGGGLSAGSAGLSLGSSGATAGSSVAPSIGAGMDPYSLAGTTMPEAATMQLPSVTQQAVAPEMKFMDVFKGDTGTFGSRLGTYMQENPKTTAMTGATLANMIGQRPPGVPGPERYDGPLSRFRYDPDRYRPAFAGGGIADLPAAMRYNSGGLGMHSDGGQMTKDLSGGDGMDDMIPATIGDEQPARLADGEFVIPADVVSHLGNGSTDAGARQLYAMMDRIRKERTGNEKQGKEINPRKMLPA